ncbi:hypothetical protein CYLTODRAFT_408920 [Cylindrobasidium torrendii FP15055 ss-10]|uniref:Uncharacterized protein n=1 Tax=Cylindrobasidium torrendii FP15055 ss-10 TaxID=1314674 RepID=A0A0D7BJM8_9AGAR|nr:hypothetical protein CYLTODRAFT_408920 [Cylindrobasidium torrendii FP15055 ss-10]
MSGRENLDTRHEVTMVVPPFTPQSKQARTFTSQSVHTPSASIILLTLAPQNFPRLEVPPPHTNKEEIPRSTSPEAGVVCENVAFPHPLDCHPSGLHEAAALCRRPDQRTSASLEPARQTDRTPGGIIDTIINGFMDCVGRKGPEMFRTCLGSTVQGRFDPASRVWRAGEEFDEE